MIAELRRSRNVLALALAVLSASSHAAAQAKGAVRLRNGGTLYGELMEVMPGDYVRIRQADGTSRTVKWADVERVDEEGKPSTCSKDADCPSAGVCEGGKCVQRAAAPAVPGACGKDSDCPSIQICNQQRCVDPGAKTPAAPPGGALPAGPPAGAVPAGPPGGNVPAARLPGSVTIGFEPKKPGASFHVAVQQAGGPVQECDAPCSLDLQPGPAEVSISGAASFKRTVSVPTVPSRYTVEKGSTGLLAAGAVIGGIGLVGCLVISIISTANSNQSPQSLSEAQQNKDDAETRLYLALGFGAAAITGAVMVFSAGKNDVAPYATPVTPKKASLQPPADRLQFRGVGASPLPSGGGFLGASFSF